MGLSPRALRWRSGVQRQSGPAAVTPQPPCPSSGGHVARPANGNAFVQATIKPVESRPEAQRQPSVVKKAFANWKQSLMPTFLRPPFLRWLKLIGLGLFTLACWSCVCLFVTDWVRSYLVVVDEVIVRSSTLYRPDGPPKKIRTFGDLPHRPWLTDVSVVVVDRQRSSSGGWLKVMYRRASYDLGNPDGRGSYDDDFSSWGGLGPQVSIRHRGVGPPFVGPINNWQIQLSMTGYWQGTGKTETRMLLAVPYWAITIVAVFGCLTLSMWWIRRRRIFVRAIEGRCLRCGYDLRATPDRCPECGTVPASVERGQQVERDRH